MVTSDFYEGMVKVIEILVAFDPDEETPEGKLLNALSAATEEYEKVKYPIKPPTLKEAEAFRRDQEKIMKKWKVVGILTGTVELGEYEAETKEEAEDMSADSEKSQPCLCHSCSDEVELSDIHDYQTTEVKPG